MNEPDTDNAHRGAGLLIVISGPSGVGKTTITHRLVDRLGAAFSVSMTTRAKTAEDREGVDYYFVDHERFEHAIESGELLEWAHVFDSYYGTPRQPVERQLAAGRDVILEIDVNGAAQVKHRMPEALAIFVEPPDEDELLRRLRARGRDDEATIQRRFHEAQREVATAHGSNTYDHFLVNRELAATVEEAERIVERHRAAAAGPGP